MHHNSLTTSTFMSINFSYGPFVLILYCTPICLVESPCWTKSPSSSSDLRTLSISIFSFCWTFPSTSIILVKWPLVYPLISGNIPQPKMESSLRQYTQNWVHSVVYWVTGLSWNNPICQTHFGTILVQCGPFLIILDHCRPLWTIFDTYKIVDFWGARSFFFLILRVRSHIGLLTNLVSGIFQTFVRKMLLSPNIL